MDNLLLKDKYCLITGATSGIGKSAALKMSNMGANITFIARNPDKAKSLVEEIIKVSDKKPRAIIADLSSQNEIRRASEEYLQLDQPLHILLNNAGIVNINRKLTKDGLEEVFAVNHLAYFSLTLLLLKKMKESSPGRIVNVASAAHKFIPRINLEDLQSENSFKTFVVYGQSKLANILFTRKLSKLLEKEKLTVNCLHPGWVSTSLGAQNENTSLLPKLMGFFSPLLAKSSDRGAETSVFLCSSPDVSGVSGEYFANCKIEKTSQGTFNESDSEKLWDISLKLTKLNYP